MKKKGFTLVELLAVIVILAVIALIAVPTILGVIDKAKRSSLQDSGYGLVEAANLYYAQYQNSKTVRFDIENNKITTKEENKLNYKGIIKNGTVLINKKGQVTVCINDGKHAAYKNYQDTKVIVVDSKTCTIPESSYIVYIDNEATITEMTNQELTQEIENLKSEISTLKNELSTLDDSILSSESILDKVYPIGSIYISIDSTDPSELFGGTWETYAEGKTLVGVDSSDTNYNSVNKTGGSSTVTLSVSNLPSHTHSIPSLNGTALSTGSGYSITYGSSSRNTSKTGTHIHNILQNSTNVAATVGTTSAHMAAGGDYFAPVGTVYEAYAGSNGDHTHTVSDYYATSISGIQAHTHSVTTTASTTGATGSGASFSVQNPYITVYVWKRVS